MLRHGDPYHPGEPGAVLEYRDDCAVATIEPHFVTSVFESPEIYFFYVQGGEGRLDSGDRTKSFDLHPDVGIIMPPNGKQRFTNATGKQLSMIMVTWKDNDGITSPKEILARDANTIPVGANRSLDTHGQEHVQQRGWPQHRLLGDLLPTHVLRRATRSRARRRRTLGEGRDRRRLYHPAQRNRESGWQRGVSVSAQW
jgi:mannose-6-phosphate isomerase-like protein (cupin superfamily)